MPIYIICAWCVFGGIRHAPVHTPFSETLRSVQEGNRAVTLIASHWARFQEDRLAQFWLQVLPASAIFTVYRISTIWGQDSGWNRQSGTSVGSLPKAPHVLFPGGMLPLSGPIFPHL